MSSRILAGRYELIEKIGEGGMAVVYKARCRLLNRFVAIKILKPEFTKDPKVIESFRRESQAAASLSHPNIVNVFDVGKEGNIHYIVMELIEGKVLSEVIKEEGPLDGKRAVSITKQIASALSLAHKNHIIHRDVKPHNILITEDGVAKITDFGIAKAVNTGTIVGNRTNTIMGSVHYFSPEQARGGYVDEKSDIYSLGIVLYEMITGKVPFDAENPVAVAVMHMNDDIVPPSQVVPGISPDVEEVVMKATQKYQVNRYKTAEEMVTALNLVNYNLDSRASRRSQEDDNKATKVMPAIGRAEAVEDTSQDADWSLDEETGENGDSEKAPMGKEKKKGKKIKKIRLNKVKLAAVALALICAVPVSGYLLNVVRDLTSPVEVKVPDLYNMTQDEAESELESLGLTLKVDDVAIFDSEVEAGRVVRQSRASGDTVRKGQSVTVTLSKGETEGIIPDLHQKTLEGAESILKLAGYELVKPVTYAYHDDYPTGTIISQNPAANTEAERGTKVTVTVSQGSAQKPMPDLRGKTYNEAVTLLRQYGFVAGETSNETSTEYAAGRVISQSIPPEQLTNDGTPVDMVISSGLILEEPDPDPDPGEGNSDNGNEGEENGQSGAGAGGSTEGTVDLVVNFSDYHNQILFLTISVIDESGSRKPIENAMRYRDDASEIIPITGVGKGTITITFDNDLIRQYKVDFSTGTLE